MRRVALDLNDEIFLMLERLSRVRGMELEKLASDLLESCVLELCLEESNRRLMELVRSGRGLKRFLPKERLEGLRGKWR